MSFHIHFPICVCLFVKILPVSQSEACPSIATVDRHESENQQQHSDSLEFHSSLPPFVLITSISEINIISFYFLKKSGN